MKEVGIALVGLGMIARTHLTAITTLPIVHALPFRPVPHTLVTSRPDEVRDAALAMGFRRVTSDIAEALRDPEVAVVDVCTPNTVHESAVAPSLRAGKAVYCEKPLSHSEETSRRLSDLAASSAVVNQVALNYRYHRVALAAQAAMQSEMIGELLHFRLHYMHSGYLDPARPLSWRTSKEASGGGAIVDLGVHAVDLIRMICGEIESFCGRTQTFIKERTDPASGSKVAIQVDDWARVDMGIRGGADGYIEVSRVALGAEAQRLELYGTKGSIVADFHHDHCTVNRFDGRSELPPKHPVASLLPAVKLTMGTFVDSHQASLLHFLRRASGDPFEYAHPATFADAYAAERIIHEVIRRDSLS